jgi:hypothetical protein
MVLLSMTPERAIKLCEQEQREQQERNENEYKRFQQSLLAKIDKSISTMTDDEAKTGIRRIDLDELNNDMGCIMLQRYVKCNPSYYGLHLKSIRLNEFYDAHCSLVLNWKQLRSNFFTESYSHFMSDEH